MDENKKQSQKSENLLSTKAADGTSLFRIIHIGFVCENCFKNDFHRNTEENCPHFKFRSAPK